MNTRFKLSILFLLAWFQAFAQVPDTSTAEKKARYNIGRIRDNTIRAITPGDFRSAFKAVTDLSVTRVPFVSISELMAGKADTARVVTLLDQGKFGTVAYDSKDTTSAADSVLVFRVGAKRYKRQFNGAADLSWWGAVGDGTDETAKIQKAINNPLVKELRIPRKQYRINWITIPSNKHIIFEDGAELFGLGDSLRPSYQMMIVIKDAQNVKISGRGYIHDLKSTYPTGTAGQYQGCIRIEGSTNITVQDVRIADVGGDGIYLGSGTGGVTNTNIRIENVWVDNFNRNGLSLITADRIWITNCSFTNGSGAAPGNGIDIEPNGSWEVVKGVKIMNPYTQNNAGGILIALAQHSNSSQVADIVIENHTDDGSLINFTIQQTAGNFNGSIVVKNPVWRNAFKCAFLAYNYAASGPRVDIYNPIVLNSMSGSLQQYGFDAAYLFYRHSSDTGVSLLGNIHLHEPSILDTRTPAKNIMGFVYADASGAAQTSRWTNCSIMSPKVIQIQSPWYKIVTLNAATMPLITDRYGVLSKDIGDVATTIRSNYGTTISEGTSYYYSINNTSSTAAANVTLHDNLPNGAEVNFEVTAAQTLKITPFSGWALSPLQGANGALQSSVVGSTMTLKKDAAMVWKVKSISGTWTNPAGDVIFGRMAASITNTATTAPSKASLQTTYGSTRANTMIVYPNISGGARKYRKMDDAAAGGWEEILATGAWTVMP